MAVMHRGVWAALIFVMMTLAACERGGPAANPCTGPADAPAGSGGSYEVGAAFAPFYAAHGGERVFGPAIGPPTDEDGVQVQYFTNARLEYHPDAMPDQRVRLTPLLVLRHRPPDPPAPLPAADDTSAVYYAVTGHSIRDRFLVFYNEYGGPTVFGYPLTEVIVEGGRQLQYFEYAILYWDPDAAPGARVRLAPLGCMALHPELSWWDHAPRAFAGGLVVAAPFRDFYERYGDEAVFGPPLTNAATGADGVTAQVFENARMEIVHAPRGPLVRLSPLGAALAPADAAPHAEDGATCFAETGHCLSADALAFFNAHGGRAVFGLPRSPVLTDPVEQRQVQYLDGVRLEWDEETGQLRLSPLGRWLLEGRIPGLAP